MLKNKKGVALLVVLGVLLVVAILVNAILAIILSHSRFTQHKVGRIEAYYASLGAINYAMDYLAQGYVNLATCGGAGGCVITPNPALYNLAPGGDFDPPSISSVTIIVKAHNAPAGGVPRTEACDHPSGNGACINVVTQYTTPQ